MSASFASSEGWTWTGPAALLEVAIGVEARAGGREQDHLAGLRISRGGAHRVAQLPAAAELHPAVAGRLEIALERPGGVADQVTGHAPLGDGTGQALEAAGLERAAQDRPHAAAERAERGRGGRD